MEKKRRRLKLPPPRLLAAERWLVSETLSSGDAVPVETSQPRYDTFCRPRGRRDVSLGGHAVQNRKSPGAEAASSPYFLNLLAVGIDRLPAIVRRNRRRRGAVGINTHSGFQPSFRPADLPHPRHPLEHVLDPTGPHRPGPPAA